MWSNPYLSSWKVAKYFHRPNQDFNKTHLSDSEKEALASRERESTRREEYIKIRNAEKAELQKRRTEREVLQCASSQALTECADSELASEITISNPSYAAECKYRQSISYKDPSKLLPLTPVFPRYKVTYRIQYIPTVTAPISS